MFSLEHEIAKWRKQMLAAGIKTPVPLNELEIHMREHIEALVRSGRDEKAAFDEAIQEIGPVPAIRNEFEKVEETKQARNWKFYEIFFLAATLWIPLLVGSLAFCFKNGAFSEMTFIQQMSCFVAATAFSLIAWGMRLSFGRFPVIGTNGIRNAIFLPVLLWLLALAYVIMPRSNLTESQNAMLSLWGFAPFGILIGWVWGHAGAARKKIGVASS